MRREGGIASSVLWGGGAGGAVADSEHSRGSAATHTASHDGGVRVAPGLDSRTVMRSVHASYASPSFQRALLRIIDLGAIALALGVATAVAPRLRAIELSTQDYYATAGWAVIWLASLWMFGAHALKHVRAGSTEYRRAINATFMAGGVVGITCYLLAYDYPRTLFATWMMAGVATLCIVRLTRRRIMHRLHLRDLFITPVLVAGGGHHVGEVARVLQRERWLGYRI